MPNDKTDNDDKNKTREVVFTEEQEDAYRDALKTCQDLTDILKEVGAPIRELALGITKLEEAEMWIERGFEELDLDPYDGDDEDDEEDDEGDDDSPPRNKAKEDEE